MTELYTMPGHLIRRLQQISMSLFAEQMKANGLVMTSPQFATLSVLSANPGIDQATLAGLIALDRPTTGGVIERLEARGLVRRRVSTTDRRAKVLWITPQGERLLEKLHPIVVKLQPDILLGLTDDEREEFVRLAAKAVEAGNKRSRAPLIRPESSKEVASRSV